MILKLKEHLGSLEKEHKEKTTFWATEAESMAFDIYHKWIGTKPTNPPDAHTQMIFNAGKMMEIALVEQLEDAGLIVATPEEQLHIEMTRGVPISGYVDAVHVDGSPIEIKTFYGTYAVRDLKMGKPRVSYLKQLAIYMDALKQKKGYLIYMERGTGELFEFELHTNNFKKFRCLDIEFDIEDTYKRWGRLYDLNILPKVEPKPDYRYKIPVSEIDWRTLSKSNIGKARNGQKVIGDHPLAVQYSNYKNLIIEKEGASIGYTQSEITQIKNLTKGYTTW